ncbi:hypothetical protein AAG906_020774 [Vitis piasezkii]
MANAHKRVNSLVKIKINGSWVTEERDIKDGVVQAFHSLLLETDEWRPKCNGLQVGGLEREAAAMLEAPFSEEEVFGALSDLNGIKLLVLMGKFVKSINASFLVLIPKKGGAEDLKDFRPISLVGSLYKLLANVLANRLKKVMGKIASKSQNAFGDPLSPYLFVIVMEALSCLLKRAKEGEIARIIAVGRVENVEELTLEFGCKVNKLPSSYLGLPLGARYKEVAIWDRVEERLRKRLSFWKRRYLQGGRMTLIRTTPKMSISVCPCFICQRV